MSTTDEQNERIQRGLPDVPPENIAFARQQWQPINVMRRIIKIEADQMIEAARTNLENCTLEHVPQVRGEITGIRNLLARINAQGND